MARKPVRGDLVRTEIWRGWILVFILTAKRGSSENKGERGRRSGIHRVQSEKLEKFSPLHRALVL